MTPGSRQLKALVKLLKERCPTLDGRIFPIALPQKLDAYPAAVFARQGSLQDDAFRGPGYQPAVGIAVLAPFPRYDEIEQAMGEVFRALQHGGDITLHMNPELPRDSLDYEAHVGDAQKGLLRQEIQVVLNQ